MKTMKSRRPPRPTTRLRFTPTAWAKLLFLRDAGDTEIGGFGLSRPDDLLYIEDVALVQQEASPAFVAFDDLAVAEFYEQQIDAGRSPTEFGRVWIHTHPGVCPEPSGVDEKTFARVFGSCDWAVMAILARGGDTYARLSWHVGPGGAWEIPVEVDFSRPFAGSEQAAWQAEYERCVQPQTPMIPSPDELGFDWYLPSDDLRVAAGLVEEPALHTLVDSFPQGAPN